MRKLMIITLFAGLVLAPATAMARKQTNKYEKQVVVIEEETPKKEEPKPVPVTNPKKQLYGEWTIIQLRKKDVQTTNRAYVYLDFNGNKVYGNNGCNTINGSFMLQGNNISFNDLIHGTESCSNASSERNMMKALGEVKSFELSALYNMCYLVLKNAKGQEIMKLRRLNFDFLNGPWLVKEIGGTNTSDKNIRVVIDIEMLTINALTKCNIINGVVNIDPRKEMEVQFEDLISSHNQCSDIDVETQMLINLEETVSCKKINDNEMALLDNKGTIIIVLSRLDLKKERGK